VAIDVVPLRRAPFDAPGLAFEKAVDHEAGLAARALEAQAAALRPVGHFAQVVAFGAGREQAFQRLEHGGAQSTRVKAERTRAMR
jgi:hypothetical protein